MPSKPLYAFALVAACHISATAADWPQYRGPNRDGHSSETAWSSQWPREGPKQLWKTNVGVGSATVTASGGRLYTMGFAGGKESVVCLNAETGEPVWKHSYDSERFDNMHEGGPACAPAVDGESVYALSRAGVVLCLEAASGKLMWSLDTVKEFGAELPFFAFTSSPLVLGGRLITITGAKGASTVALDKASGKVLWKSGDDPSGYASPVPFPEGKDTHVAVLNGVALVILNAENGNELARFPWDNPSPANSRVNAASPVVSGSQVFIAASYGMGAAMIGIDLAARKTKAVWQNDELSTQYNTALLHKGHLYGFHSYGQTDNGGELRCVDAASGAVRWSQKNPGLGALIEANGKLIILTRSGELVVAEAAPEKYNELARAQITGGLCRSEPTLSNGRLYIRNVRGDIHCLDVK